MSFIGLLYGLKDIFVDAEADSCGQSEERYVSKHRHHGATCQRHQQRQTGAQRRARPCWLAPVYQRLHWKTQHIYELPTT